MTSDTTRAPSDCTTPAEEVGPKAAKPLPASIPRCPTCGSRISKDKLDEILRVSLARKKQLADAEAALRKEREALEGERAEIARAAAEEERATWKEKEVLLRNKITADLTRLQASVDAENKRLAATLEKKLAAEAKKLAAETKKLAAETKKREAAEKQALRDRAAAEARACALAAARAREARAQEQARAREARDRLQEQHERLAEALRRRLETEVGRRMREREAWKKRIEEFEHKADSADSLHFGPESEAELEADLKKAYPGDRIERRNSKGDVRQGVMDAGRVVGTLVHERKKTRGWKRQDLRQIQAAMEEHGTRHGLLVTRFFPRGRSVLAVVEGVVLVAPEVAVTAAGIVREGILAVERMKLSEEGKDRKMEELFAFVRSDEFGDAMRLVAARVEEERGILDHERSYHEGWWRRRLMICTSIARAAGSVEARVREVLGAGAGAHTNGVAAKRGAGGSAPKGGGTGAGGGRKEDG